MKTILLLWLLISSVSLTGQRIVQNSSSKIPSTHHDIFYLVGGQSNAVGSTSSPPSYINTTLSNVYKWNGSSYSLSLGTGIWGPVIELMYREQIRRGGDVYYFNNATSGCCLATTGGGGTQCDLSGLLSSGLSAYNYWVSNFNPTNPVIVLIWIQGNQDAATSANSLLYYDNLINFFASVRSNFGYQQMAIIYDRLSINCTKPYLSNVRIGQQAVGSKLESGRDVNIIINSDDCPLQDGDHYNTTGAQTLGQIMSNKIAELFPL